MNKFILWFYRNIVLGKELCSFIDNYPDLPDIYQKEEE